MNEKELKQLQNQWRYKQDTLGKGKEWFMTEEQMQKVQAMAARIEELEEKLFYFENPWCP